MDYAKLVELAGKLVAQEVRETAKETGYTEENAMDLVMETFAQDVADYALAELMDEEDV